MSAPLVDVKNLVKTFPTTTPADVIREIVNRYPVLDLFVSEPDIEEVVARIYRENAALRRRDEYAGAAEDSLGSPGVHPTL